MAFEVTCSQCQGRLRVEQAGKVACPHCGTHLDVGAPPEAAQGLGPTPAVTPTPALVPTPPTEASAPATVEPAAEAPAAVADSGVPAVGEQMPFLGDAVAPAAGPADEVAGGGSALDDEEESESVLPGGDDFTAPAPAPGPPAAAVAPPAPVIAAPTPAPVMPVESAASAAVVPAVETGSSVHTTGSAPGALPRPDSVIQTGSSSSIIRAYAAEKLKGTVSKKVFALVLSYASAVTLAVLYLGWQVANGGGSASELESLPDVKPIKSKGGQIGMKLIPEDSEMPPGHKLMLGDTRRFGNLEVTPLRVTRGPVQFEFFQKGDSRTREDGDEILQLWLQFKNVSEDQSISPLEALVFRRVPASRSNSDLDRANTFVCAKSQKTKTGHRVLSYELNEKDVWNLRGQDVGHEIPPGETVETYVPTTEEGVSKLLGDGGPYVWRVHFRKGYSPRGYGVTTVVEVDFDKSDIVTGDAAESSSTGENDEPAEKQS